MTKKLLVTCGPVPAKLGPFNYLTGMSRGSLAFRTASWLARDPELETTVVCWKRAEIPPVCADWHKLVTVDDIMEYHAWITEHAKDFDAFVFAAAEASAVPAGDWDGELPDYGYAGKTVQVGFKPAPRAIDAVRKLNPAARVFGYKIMRDDDDALLYAARQVLENAGADIVFAARPNESKTGIRAVVPGGYIPMEFGGHLEMLKYAIRQEYFRTETWPLTAAEKADPDVLAAMDAVRKHQGRSGGIAVPVANSGGMFAVTAKDRDADPVLVRSVDPEAHTVNASGEPIPSAPAIAAMLPNFPDYYIVYKQFDALDADQEILKNMDAHEALHGKYAFPGSDREYKKARACMTGILCCPRRGYVAAVLPEKLGKEGG